MNFIDFLLAGVTGLGFAKGLRRGLAEELYRIINMGFGLITGLGLFKISGNIAGALPGVEDGNASALGFLGSFGAAVAIITLIKSKIKNLLEAKLKNPHARTLGGIIGGGKAAIAGLAALCAATLSDISFLEKITSGSAVGSLIEKLIGG